jgi:hypothetical protein
MNKLAIIFAIFGTSCGEIVVQPIHPTNPCGLLEPRAEPTRYGDPGYWPVDGGPFYRPMIAPADCTGAQP